MPCGGLGGRASERGTRLAAFTSPPTCQGLWQQEHVSVTQCERELPDEVLTLCPLLAAP